MNQNPFGGSPGRLPADGNHFSCSLQDVAAVAGLVLLISPARGGGANACWVFLVGQNQRERVEEE